MKLPLSVLKQFIEINLPFEDTLAMLGIEVDAVHTPKAPFSGVVVAEVKACEKHPNSDKLQVAQVFDGKQTVQVVCGAPNCRTGLRVAFAQAGAVLPEMKIGKSVIRGSESNGMLCSATELGLYEDHAGILELDDSCPAGTDCLSLLWDPVLEISLTPNLGHCMSALGIARELSAALNIPLKKSTVKANTEALNLSVSVPDAKLCPRYSARLIENVTVAPSPFWLQKTLLAAGLRPVNNIVDATNYLLLKNGQPLHAFDYDKLEGKSIEVHALNTNQSFDTLIGTKVEIPAGTIVISDAKKPVAIAGVMGGANSAVSNDTKNILLESASFEPIAVRIASKKLGLRSDSSHRFEKGVDPSTTLEFLNEAAELIATLGKGTVKGFVDIAKEKFAPKQIAVRTERVNQVLGTTLSENEIHDIFRRLGFIVKGKIVEVPLYRGDISEEIDLVEEVARIYGYNNIARPLPRATTPQIPHDVRHLFETEMRERLIALGLQEFLNCDLISPKLAELIPLTSMRTLHSKSEEYSVLRPSLLPGLLQSVRSNIDQKNHTIAAFELGHVHYMDSKPVETPMAAIILTGKEQPHHWDRKPPEADFFDLKGLVENFLRGLRVSISSAVPSKNNHFHPSRQAEIFVGKISVGAIGELHPDLLAKFDIKQKVYYAELNASHLLALQGPHPKMAPLPQFPASERDATISLPPKMHVSILLDKIRSIAPPLLERFEIIDLFHSEDKTNVTLRFTYRDKTKTVSFEEVEAAHAPFREDLLAKTNSDS